MGGVSSHHPTRGLGDRRKLPQRGPGGAPAENGFYAHFRSEKAIWNTIFSIFERRQGPPNVAGPGKTFLPFPPSRRACLSVPLYLLSLLFMDRVV